MIHHSGGEFRMGVTHHDHHKKKGNDEYVSTTQNLMIAPRRIITHFLSLMTFWMKSSIMNYKVLGMVIMVITKSKLQRKTS
jgi:hypothetical protein